MDAAAIGRTVAPSAVCDAEEAEMSSTMICFDGSPSAHRRSPTARSTVTRLADVAAESITETFGAHVHARTFVPTIEGVLMTGGTPRYLCARRASPGAAGESVFETRPPARGRRRSMPATSARTGYRQPNSLWAPGADRRVWPGAPSARSRPARASASHQAG
jgi:hypothetical protein